jgi:hypothetical protein
LLQGRADYLGKPDPARRRSGDVHVLLMTYVVPGRSTLGTWLVDRLTGYGSAFQASETARLMIGFRR